MKRIAVVVDFQNDFVKPDGKLPVPSASALIDPVNRYLRSLDPVVYVGALFTFDTHPREGWSETDEGKIFPPHCIQGEPGWDLACDPYEVPAGVPLFDLKKPVFDMWANPELPIGRLRSYDEAAGTPWTLVEMFTSWFLPAHHEIDVLGVASDYCVKDAVLGFIKFNYRIRILPHLMAGIQQDIYQVTNECFAHGDIVFAA